jgi:hypothetical protein
MLRVRGEFDVASRQPSDHWHREKQSSRKLGDPSDIELFGVGSVGEGEMPWGSVRGVAGNGYCDSLFEIVVKLQKRG